MSLIRISRLLAITAGFTIIAILIVSLFLAVFTNSFITCSRTSSNGVTEKIPCSANSDFLGFTGGAGFFSLVFLLIFIVAGIIPLMMAYLAIRAGASVQEKPVGAGIRMIVYSCLIFFVAYSTAIAVIPGVLLLLGGIFAIVGANTERSASYNQSQNYSPGSKSTSYTSSINSQPLNNKPLTTPSTAVNPFYTQAFNEAIAEAVAPH